ncbi:hypothetical protein [uncultured Clostridium sp.]|uniref:hypothetical protein n=1 Tax=uncultured Clostridium sp. TaxID=59620 RepID=UPI0028F05140|nr:hypothetical protein [uncultured Clostridium sp.]
MKRNFLKMFIGVMFISLYLIFYVINTNSSKHANSIIDLTGSNGLWKASLNIHFKYDSELIIRPMSDNFEVPSEISIDIIADNNCVYTDRLKYIPDSNEKLLGEYMLALISDDYFKKDIKDVDIIIRFNDESSSILLN